MNAATIIHITEDRVGQRIDNFLLGQLKKVSRPRIYNLLRKGEIRVNKGRIKPAYRLQAGDILRLPPDNIVYTQINNNIPNKKTDPEAIIELYQQKAENILKNAILYEDEQILILNKPAGIAVHGGSGLEFGLIELLRAYGTKHKNYQHIELVHRLDRETSGCLLLSKKRSMLRNLHAMLRERQISKIYHALVKGKLSSAEEIKLPLKKIALSKGKELVKVDHANGALAITTFKPLATAGDLASLVEAQPITGKTHQIRVHAAAIGKPIAGDDRYGDKQFNTSLQQQGLKRLFLHARELAFICPKTGEKIIVQAKYDKALTQTLKNLNLCNFKTRGENYAFN